VSCAGGAHSDEDNQDYDNNDGKDEDSDDDNSDDENNSKSNYAPCDDEESDDDDSKHDSHRYSIFIDSSLLEDEEPPESYRVDWVKGKGAGRKASKGRPPQPDTTLITAQMRLRRQSVNGRKIRREIGTSCIGKIVGVLLWMGAALLMALLVIPDDNFLTVDGY
jgi:hypothetical protein